MAGVAYSGLLLAIKVLMPLYVIIDHSEWAVWASGLPMQPQFPLVDSGVLSLGLFRNTLNLCGAVVSSALRDNIPG